MNEKDFNQVEAEYVDTFRIKLDERVDNDVVCIDFGKFGDGGNVDIKASVELPIDILRDLVYRTFITGQLYQEQTGKDVGFPKLPQSDDQE